MVENVVLFAFSVLTFNVDVVTVLPNAVEKTAFLTLKFDKSSVEASSVLTTILLPNMVEKMVRLAFSVDTFSVDTLMVLPEMDEKSF
jgi:hypothetical protein